MDDSLVGYALVSPGVYAQNEDTDLDATLNYIKDTILRYCGDNTFQYLDVQRSGQGVDVTLVVIVRIQGTTEKRLFPLKEFDVDRIQFVHPGTENSGVYLHAVGHNPLTGGEGYEWAWVRCANVEIGASLAKAFQRAARISAPAARTTTDCLTASNPCQYRDWRSGRVSKASRFASPSGANRDGSLTFEEVRRGQILFSRVAPENHPDWRAMATAEFLAGK